MRSSTVIRVAKTGSVVTLDVSADVIAAGCRHNIISITASAADLHPMAYSGYIHTAKSRNTGNG